MANPWRERPGTWPGRWVGIGLLLFLLVTGVLSATSLHARGEDPPADAHQEKGHAPEDHHKEGGAKEETHKDNPFKGNIDLSIWSFCVFLVLVVVLGRYAWPLVLDGLAKRENSIARALDEARKAQEEAAALRLQLQADRDKANQELRQLMEDARRNAQQLQDEIKARAQEDIKAERERLRRDIATAQDQALQEIWKQSSQLATLISAKAIRRSLSEEDHRRLVDEALVDLRQATTQRNTI